jgi:hypothetical protein
VLCAAAHNTYVATWAGTVYVSFDGGLPGQPRLSKLERARAQTTLDRALAEIDTAAHATEETNRDGWAEQRRSRTNLATLHPLAHHRHRSDRAEDGSSICRLVADQGYEGDSAQRRALNATFRAGKPGQYAATADSQRDDQSPAGA